MDPFLTRSSTRHRDGPLALAKANPPRLGEPLLDRSLSGDHGGRSWAHPIRRTESACDESRSQPAHCRRDRAADFRFGLRLRVGPSGTVTSPLARAAGQSGPRWSRPHPTLVQVRQGVWESAEIRVGGRSGNAGRREDPKPEPAIPSRRRARLRPFGGGLASVGVGSSRRRGSRFDLRAFFRRCRWLQGAAAGARASAFARQHFCADEARATVTRAVQARPARTVPFGLKFWLRAIVAVGHNANSHIYHGSNTRLRQPHDRQPGL